MLHHVWPLDEYLLYPLWLLCQSSLRPRSVLLVLETIASRFKGNGFLDTADQSRLDVKGHCIN
jgi:hypothetical protein